MKRCTSCFRYSPGRPSYCPHCGRSYGVRLCGRGHANPRHAQFCAQCGSDDLSTPSAPESPLSRLSHWSLRLCVTVSLLAFCAAIALSFIAALDWSQLTPAFIRLGLVLALLYWANTLLPGPVKKVGKAVGRGAWTAIRNRGGHGRR